MLDRMILGGGFGEGAWLVMFLVVQRLAELMLAQLNTQRLRAAGAVEYGQSHYHVMVALHAFWLASLWVAGHDRAVSLPWLAVFLILQAGRVWVIATLGRRWTTRVIVLPGAPAVTRGPYRFLRHPNYWIVALEIAVVPMALGLPVLAAVFSVANAAMLVLRIRIENAALDWAHSAAISPDKAAPDCAPTLANGGARR